MNTATNDSRPQTSRPAAIYNRKRATAACTVCRERKTKCDGQRPVCGFCRDRGGSCRYAESDASRLDPGSLEILSRLGGLEESLKSYIGETLALKLGSPERSTIVPTSLVQDKQPIPHRRGSSGLLIPSQLGVLPSSLYHQVQQPGLLTESQDSPHSYSSSATVPIDVPPSTEILNRASDMSFEAVTKWPIFTELAPHLATDLHISSIEVLAKDSSATKVREEDIQKAMQNLTPKVVDRLVENFLANNHIKNPVLDVDSLRSYAEDFKNSGPQWDGTTCLVLIVCAVSGVSRSLEEERGVFMSEECLREAQAYFLASQRRIGMLHHENSILAGQCTFLTGVYLCLTNQIIAGWKSFVHASNQCLGWLRSNGRLQRKEGPTDDESEDMALETDHEAPKQYVEESLYWSCLKSEMELRFELCLPGSGLNRFNYQNVYPSPPINDDLGTAPNRQQSKSLLVARSPSNTQTDRYNLEMGWLYYLAEIASKRIRNNVWVESYATQADHATWVLQLQKRVAEFDWQMQEWYKALPEQMKFPADPSIPTRNILRYILRHHMIDTQEDVRFPAIQAILGSTHLSLDTEQFSPILISIVRQFLTNAVSRIKISGEGMFHRHHGVWLGIRCVGRSSLQLLGMACKCHRDGGYNHGSELEGLFLPPGWNDTIQLALSFLDYWACESSDARRIYKIISGLSDVYDAISHQ